VTAQIGVGGMGEVYRARDTKLNRDVALKILPDSFALDGDGIARFRREAQVLASLNHPNIAAIYGFEDSSSTHALVLELVDGPTLADRIAKGPIPLDEALPIGKQIVEALEAAHEQGIIHRDLKPANIKLRDDGTVKVLDFGLAKAMEPISAISPALTASPTITTPAMMTGVGMILGTAAYMSPEQAKGRPADKRSDVWAFGCVLYEMFTGTQAFDAEDVADTLAAILTRSPAWDALPPTVPPTVRRLLHRCLERDRRRRLADIADARLELDDVSTEPAVTISASEISRRKRRPWLGAAISLVVAAGVGSAAWTIGRRTEMPSDQAPVFRAEIALPAALIGQAGARVAFSPDGRHLAFVAPDVGGRAVLWVRPLDAATAQALAGTEGAEAPFWSPDSRSIAFTAMGKLKRIGAAGGSVVPLTDAAVGFRGAWNNDGVILFTPSGLSGLFRVSASGGSPARVTTPGEPTVRHVFPTFLPDGRHFVYYSSTANGSSRQIRIGSLDGQETKALPLPAAASSPSFANGRLLFVSGTTLFAQPLDTTRFELQGDAVPLAEDVETDTTGRLGAAFSVSSNGAIVFQPTTRRRTQLTWFDRQGRTLGTAGEPARQRELVLSSHHVGEVAVDRANAIWIVDLNTGVGRPLTEPTTATYAVWSPSDDRIVFASRRSGRMDLYEAHAADPAGAERVLYADKLDKFPTSWSPDGRYLLFQAVSLDTGADVWVLPLTGERTPRPMIKTPANERQARFSPDGHWVAYTSDESGRTQVNVAPFPGPGRAQVISAAGGDAPHWARSGKELFFVTPDKTLSVASIDTEGGVIVVHDVKPLFQIKTDDVPTAAYDAAPDGQRFLVASPVDEVRVPSLTLIVNWPAALKPE
jgi:Tol biopolymer transport system component